jgi:hypothetical protein
VPKESGTTAEIDQGRGCRERCYRHATETTASPYRGSFGLLVVPSAEAVDAVAHVTKYHSELLWQGVGRVRPACLISCRPSWRSSWRRTGYATRGAGNATHFVIFDACRNTLKLKKSGSRAMVQSKDFFPVAQETGMLIAYSTAEGELASDVGAGAGPYAKVLAEEIVKPGVRRDDVPSRTGPGASTMGPGAQGRHTPNPHRISWILSHFKLPQLTI